MMDAFRLILTKLLNVRWVVLVDFDGQPNVRCVRFRGGRAVALRHSFAPVVLHDGGKVAGSPYVVRWEPYDPTESNKLPKPGNIRQ